MNNYTDEKIKQAISAWIDGQADAEETGIAENAVRENPEYKAYSEELRKLSSAARQWKDEDLSTDLKRKFEKIKKGEGIPVKNSAKSSPAKIAGSVIVVGIATLMIVAYVPQMTQMAFPVPGPHPVTAGNLPVPGPVVPAPIEKKSLQTASSIEMAPVAVVAGSDLKSEALQARASVPQFLAAGKSAVSQSIVSNSYSEMAKGGHVRVLTRLAGGRPLAEAAYNAPGVMFDYSVPNTRTVFNTESYNAIEETSFKNVTDSPLSTFSIDVDTASYANLRRYLNSDTMPPADSVRIEEMINYFRYDYPEPAKNEPFSITTEISACPWMKDHQLVLIGLKGKSLDTASLPPSNLVFLIDVSGSMREPNKLPLLQKALTKMVNQLSGKEKVAIVTYAGNAGLALASTPSSEKSKILLAIENLQAGGSTAGGQGIELAYQIAKENFIKDGNNRVILATDGDFNVGASSDGEMVRLIEEKRSLGIYLTVLGFGEGNLKDSKMQQLADKGNGNYFYIDTLHEAQKVLVHELGSTLFTIAKDVKIQVEFNPAFVKSYRLVGYEKRALANEDFNNDKKDAGELGAGHTVTALYEIVPQNSKEDTQSVDALKYQVSQIKKSDELLTVKLRYKEPNADESKLITKALKGDVSVKPASENMKEAGAVAEFGLLLKKSSFKANASYDHVLDVLKEIKGEDKDNYRSELAKLVEKAKSLDETSAAGIQFKK